ncbi:hypothetical protein AHF37_09455 [Paragonimus kellicotti]|nr:hypothetical protein AHF37_09455 [Paragonimus kellicotti]
MTAGYNDKSQNAGLKKNLSHFYLVVKDQILKYQHPISGLFPLNPKDPHCKFSHVRDSIYCATVLWALHRSLR